VSIPSDRDIIGVYVNMYSGMAEVRNKFIEKYNFWNSFEIRYADGEKCDYEAVCAIRYYNLRLKYTEERYEIDKMIRVITMNGITINIMMLGKNIWSTEANMLIQHFGFDVRNLR
jgi:hypothetical protein